MARSNPQQKKLFADIWEHKGRSLVVIASITIGVFAVGVIATVFQLVLQETAETFANAVPANITLTMTDFDDDFADSVEGLSDIASVDARRQGTVKVLEASGTWTTLKFQAVESIASISLNIPEVVAGSPEPGVNEILLVSDAMEAMDVSIGDEIVVKLDDESQRRLWVVGEIADWTRNLGDIFFTKNIGFISMETLPYLQQPDAYNQLFAVIADDPEDIGAVDRMANQLTDKVEDAGGFVFNINTKVQTDTPLDTILQALLMIMLFLGALILALSVFLISNTMSALLAQQTRQIGVMKLIGAERGQIVKMYVQLSLIYGGVSLIIALPLGLLVGSIATDLIMGIINSKMTDVPLMPFLPVIMIGQVVVAILIPLGAGLLPVLKGTRVSVQKALSGNLIDQEVDASRFDRWLESRKWAEGLTLVAIRNTFRKKARLLTTVIALALGGAIFISVFNTQASLDDHLFRESKMIGTDINLQFTQPYSIDRVTNDLLAMPDITAVEAWGNAYGTIEQGLLDANVQLTAIPQNSQMVVPFLHSGRWFTPQDKQAIVVNGNFFEDYPGLELGSTVEIEIDGRTVSFQIVGETMKSAGGNLSAYLPFEDLIDITKQSGVSSSFRLSIDPPNDLQTQQKMARLIDASLEAQGYRVTRVESVVELAENTADTAAILIYVMLALAILTALVGSIGLTGTLGINILERTSEIGILRAIGANNQSIIHMVLIEGLVTGGLSYLISLVLVVPVTLVLKSLCMYSIFGTAGKFLLDWKGFAIWFGLILLFSVVSSAVPAKNASRLTIREVLAYE